MHLSITHKEKKQLFISLFHLLKSCCSITTIFFHKEKLYIQGMDPSHVCLFDISIFSDWFDSYKVEEHDNSQISINTSFLYTILSMTQEQQTIHLHYTGDTDIVKIDVMIDENSKGEFNKFFTLPLTEVETVLLEIPTVEYDAEFSIPSKKMNDLISQLSNFGAIINLQCSEEEVKIGAKDIGGEMMVHISMDDLTEYSISEGEELRLSYSLHYIHKMCVTTKLCQVINFSISRDYPLKIHYDIGNNSSVAFYIAPKIEDA
jgi:proliferating cell nuclear antigen PCNA